MGQRGPAAKPSKLRELEGTTKDGPNTENEAEPNVPDKLEKPTWFKLRNFRVDENQDRDIIKYANKFWDKNAPKMKKIGLLTEVDIDSFVSLCISYGQFVNATLNIVKNGIEKVSPKGHRQQSSYAIRQDKAFNKYRQMCKQFGVSPASRTSIEATVQDDSAPDAEDLLNAARDN